MSVLLTFIAGAAIGAVATHQLRKRRTVDTGGPEVTILNDTPEVAATVDTSLSSPMREETDAPKGDASEITEVADTSSSPAPEETTDDAPVAKDKLENIWGIGPIYAQRLREAGILTFSDLATTTAERIIEIVSPTASSPRPDVEPWLTQAAEFAGISAS